MEDTKKRAGNKKKGKKRGRGGDGDEQEVRKLKKEEDVREDCER